MAKKKTLRFGLGFRVIFGNRKAQAAEMVIAPGDAEGDARNKHRGSDQWLFVVEGTGLAKINQQPHRLRPGTLLLIEHGEFHEIRNTGKSPLRTLTIYTPPAYDSGGDPLPRGRR